MSDSRKLVVQFVVTRRRRVIGAMVLALLLVGSLAWRASWIANRLLRSWTTSTIREKSGDVYQLAVGQVHLNFVRRRLTVDSLVLSTNQEPNARRAQPLTTLGVAFHTCAIVGVHLVTLASGGGLIADSLACELVTVHMLTPRDAAPISDLPAAGVQRAFRAVQQSVQLPSFAPLVRIAQIEFPQATLDLRVERATGADSRIRLEQLRWRMANFAIDPTDTLAATYPLFSRVVEVRAADFSAHPDSGITLRVDSLVASLSDSTLEMRGMTYAPTVGRGALTRDRRYRHTVVRARIGRLSIRGVDVGAFFLGHGLRAKWVEVDSLRVGVMSDRRLPPQPGPPNRRRTPQEWIADLGRTLRVDSLRLRHGQVVYRQWRDGRAEPGVMVFARIEAVATNVRHAVGEGQGPMRLTATTWLQNVGRLDARFVVPLDARQFAMSFRGTLGAMPAADFNAFVQETFPVRVAKGQIESIAFAATVVNGSARGTITPRYTGLSVAATREGRTGILGRDSRLGGMARGIASIAGNWQKVYANNPDDRRTKMRIGEIRHTFTSNETLPTFLWTGLRGGLVSVVAR